MQDYVVYTASDPDAGVLEEELERVDEDYVGKVMKVFRVDPVNCRAEIELSGFAGPVHLAKTRRGALKYLEGWYGEPVDLYEVDISGLPCEERLETVEYEAGERPHSVRTVLVDSSISPERVRRLKSAKGGLRE